MKITYINHSAFLIEMQNVLLLFDYTEGSLPELTEDKPLLVFVSHRHSDHYSKIIFDLKEKHANTRYILSNDIKKKRIPQKYLTDIDFIGPDQKNAYQITDGGVEGIFSEESQADVEVSTYLSTDEGVAFLVKTEGKVIYHAGDLNNWTWIGEPANWNKSMANKYSGEVDKMAGMHVDAAFLPLDPRLKEAFYLGFDEFMRKVSVSHAIPMHCWKEYSIIKQLIDMEISSPYRDRIVTIKEDGECFEIE